MKEFAEKLGIKGLDVVPIDGNHTDLCIINSATKQSGGKHWTARYKQYIYDPFGVAPDTRIIEQAKRTHPTIYANTMQAQDIEEDSCGYYCLRFLYQMTHSKEPHNTFYHICTVDESIGGFARSLRSISL